MTCRVSVADLLGSTILVPAEAVAIVQQLIRSRSAGALRQPFGPPTVETVFLCADGSVICDTCDAPLAVSDLAALVDAMLPSARTGQDLPVGMSGALRYTLARARLEVDAPPFDSVEEFSRALHRHERGDRTEVVQRVVARTRSGSTDTRFDRRRRDPAVSHLRRQLRAADARVYDQQRAIDALSAMSTRPRAAGRGGALAIGMAIGLTVVGAGQLLRGPAVSQAPAATAGADAPPVAAATAGADPIPAAQPADHNVPARPQTVTRPAVKRVLRSDAAARGREPSRPRRFGWLKTRFVWRNEPL